MNILLGIMLILCGVLLTWVLFIPRNRIKMAERAGHLFHLECSAMYSDELRKNAILIGNLGGVSKVTTYYRLGWVAVALLISLGIWRVGFGIWSIL